MIRQNWEIIIQDMIKIDKLAHKLTDEAKLHAEKELKLGKLDKGKLVSRLSTAQPKEVVLTPIMKNIMNKFDPKIERLMVGDPLTKAEKFVYEYCKKYLPTKQLTYDDCSFTNTELMYVVDNIQNLKENMRDIQPGQELDRLKRIQDYLKPSQWDTTKVINMIRQDNDFRIAILAVMNQLPAVRQSEEIVQVNIPFMTKHSNVSYPFWANDRAIDPKTGKTYAQVTLDIAKETSLGDLSKYNISTLFGRNQRGKGRHIIAVSRIVNLVLNKLEHQEIEAYKGTGLFTGYNDWNKLKSSLISIYEDSITHGYELYNLDQSKFDSHIGSGFLNLVGAISISKAYGSNSKKTALYRAALMNSTYLVSSKGLQLLNGRIFSGFIDTNRCGGLVSAIISTWAMLKYDKQYSKVCLSSKPYIFVMGDDALIKVPKGFDRVKYAHILKQIGFEVNPDKGEYGPFFLQNRVVKSKCTSWLDGDPNLNYQMVYPWTRVIKSLLFKENAKGLGPYGWTLVMWQQLSKLVNDIRSMAICIKLILPFDKLGLCLDTPIKTITKKVAEEDKSALVKNDGSKRNKPSTVEALYDGDPTKEGSMVNSNFDLNEPYLARLQKILRRAKNYKL